MIRNITVNPPRSYSIFHFILFYENEYLRIKMLVFGKDKRWFLETRYIIKLRAG